MRTLTALMLLPGLALGQSALIPTDDSDAGAEPAMRAPLRKAPAEVAPARTVAKDAPLEGAPSSRTASPLTAPTPAATPESSRVPARKPEPAAKVPLAPAASTRGTTAPAAASTQADPVTKATPAAASTQTVPGAKPTSGPGMAHPTPASGTKPAPGAPPADAASAETSGTSRVPLRPTAAGQPPAAPREPLRATPGTPVPPKPTEAAEALDGRATSDHGAAAGGQQPASPAQKAPTAAPSAVTPAATAESAPVSPAAVEPTPLPTGPEAPSAVKPASTSMPPPLMEAGIVVEEGRGDTAATPAPPGSRGAADGYGSAPLAPQPGTHVPGAPNASPFGTPPAAATSSLEVGLMVSETAFGALSAAGTALVPYLLFQKSGALGGDPTISNILTLLAVAGTPLAVSSTQVGIANQSRYYTSEAWPSQLAGLGAQALVIGAFYLAGGFPIPGLESLGRPNGELILLVGTVGLVPLASMAVINLTKTPRSAAPFGGFGALRVSPDGALHVALPTPVPLLTPGQAGRVHGMLVPVASGSF